MVERYRLWCQDSDAEITREPNGGWVRHSDYARLQEQLEAVTRERKGLYWHLHECEQIAGKALGYPWYKDDPLNFPGATEADGVCIGEHVCDTIVSELATRLEAAEARAARLEALLESRDKFIVDQGLWATFVASLPAALDVKE